MQSATGFGTFCAMTLTAAGLLFMPAANAQQQAPSGPSSTTPSPTTAPANIPDKKLDAAAAAIILQDYLDARFRPASHPPEGEDL